MRAYSLDLRERVIKAYDEGHWTVGQLAERFKVGEWWIHKLKRQRQEKGTLAPCKGRVGQLRGPREGKLDVLVKPLEEEFRGKVSRDAGTERPFISGSDNKSRKRTRGASLLSNNWSAVFRGSTSVSSAAWLRSARASLI